MRWETKTPPVLGQRATIYRGTTSCSPSPRGTRPHWVLTHPIAITGEPDTSLLAPSGLSEGCSGMYSHAPSSPLFTFPEVLFAGAGACLSSCHYCISFFRFVNYFFRNMKIIYESRSQDEFILSFRRGISLPVTTAPPRPAAWSPSHGCRR